MWSREKMLKWARLLRITVPQDISDKSLYNRIMQAPATNRQMLELAGILEPLGHTMPPDMTFGRALEALHAANDQINTNVINSMGFDEGQVWRWATKSGGATKVTTLMIMRIYGDTNDHKMRVQLVTLERKPGDDLATIKARGDTFTIHPKAMYLVATKVNLETWQPGDEGIDAGWVTERMPDMDELEDPPF